jgi:CHAD domain-containing protein
MNAMEQNIRNNREIEFKWQAHSVGDYKLFLQLVKNLGAKLSRLKKVQIKDLYLDTQELFFLDSHRVCRIRNSNGHFELTLKSFSDPKQEIFIRHEKTIQLPHFTSNKTALTYCRNNFFGTIQPLFEILNDRQLYTLTLPCGTCAEANFDQVLMFHGKKKFRMHEIELEFKSGHLANFKAFVSKLSPLSLNPSKSSKFEVAMSHLLERTPLRKVETLNELANKILKINFEKLKKMEADVRTGLNSEAIHDMRVAARRFRAAMKTFKRILPVKTKKIRAKLKKLGRTLGKKRDLDVLSDFILPTVKAKSIKTLIQQSDQSQKKILSTLKSKYYSSLIESLAHLKTAKSKQNILKVARKKIQKELKRVLEIGSSIDSKADDKTLHKLRIAIKKLRYVCEFFEPIFNKYICSISAFIEKTKKIQDILGDHQDAITGISMLICYKSDIPVEEFLQIKKNYELKKMRTRKAFLKIWKDFWIGVGFRRCLPSTALELILENIKD